MQFVKVGENVDNSEVSLFQGFAKTIIIQINPCKV